MPLMSSAGFALVHCLGLKRLLSPRQEMCILERMAWSDTDIEGLEDVNLHSRGFTPLLKHSPSCLNCVDAGWSSGPNSTKLL
jgi:hypothetical protein